MNLLWKPSLTEPLKHLRKRLDKLGCNDALRCLEGYRGQRALAVLARVKTLVSPRVQASYLRTVCNGWSTRARFQESGVCRFGRGADRDSIPHFAVCPAVDDWALRHAHLHRAPVGAELDLLLCMDSEVFNSDGTSRPLASEDSMLQARAWHLYSLYRLHNAVRHHTIASGDFYGAYVQYYREAMQALFV